MNVENFAAVPSDKIGTELYRRVKDVSRFTRSVGILGMRRASYAAYYGHDPELFVHTASNIAESGDDGELKLIKINEFRATLQHVLTYICQDRITWGGRALNTAGGTLSATKLASTILDHYVSRNALVEEVDRAIELMLFMDTAYLSVTWDVDAGEQYGVGEDGRPVHEGDVRVRARSPLDVYEDPFRDPREALWRIEAEAVNRYDLAAKYPALAEKILALQPTETKRELWMGSNVEMEQSDDVRLFTFYHKPTPSLPRGRLVQFLAGDVVLMDMENPYGEIPIYRACAHEFYGTPFGYALAYDLLAPQQALDMLYSTVVTNETAVAVQSFIAEDDINIDVASLRGGMNLIRKPRGASDPAPLQLLRTSPQTYQSIDLMTQVFRALSGVNNVSRGEPDAQLRSGTALAFMESRTLHFQSKGAMARTSASEWVGGAVIRRLRQFAGTRRIVGFAGPSGAYQARAFTGKDLEGVSHIVVETGSPMQRSQAFRIEAGGALLQQPGMIKTAEQYLQLVTTGNITPLLERDTTELDLIKEENEMLSKGPPTVGDKPMPDGMPDPKGWRVPTVPVMPTDNHGLHIMENAVPLTQMQVRQNDAAQRAILAHISEHKKYAEKEAPPPGTEAPGPGGPPPKKIGMPGGDTAKMPNMPKDPSTGKVPDQTQQPSPGAPQ